MPTKAETPAKPSALFGELMMAQAQAALALFGQILPAADSDASKEAAEWAAKASRLQSIWTDFQVEQINRLGSIAKPAADPLQWLGSSKAVLRQLPLTKPDVQKRLLSEGLALAQAVLGQFGINPNGTVSEPASKPDLPRSDARFADPSWRSQPFFALVHQLYLMASEQTLALAESVEGLDPVKKRQLIFATKALIDGLSPSNFVMTNPVVLARAVETKGESRSKAWRTW